MRIANSNLNKPSIRLCDWTNSFYVDYNHLNIKNRHLYEKAVSFTNILNTVEYKTTGDAARALWRL